MKVVSLEAGGSVGGGRAPLGLPPAGWALGPGASGWLVMRGNCLVKFGCHGWARMVLWLVVLLLGRCSLLLGFWSCVSGLWLACWRFELCCLVGVLLG